MIDIFTTGGTIDKVYFDALSEFPIGPAALPDMLRANNVHVPHRVTQLMRQDSLALDAPDREAIPPPGAPSQPAPIPVPHCPAPTSFPRRMPPSNPGKHIGMHRGRHPGPVPT